MSDLREAIRDAYNKEDPSLGIDSAGLAAIMVVFEAYLREHDAQIRQRIEALLNETVQEYGVGSHSDVAAKALVALVATDE